ncbi:DNA polymerase III subunit delta [Patescibacteria group bacterium]|nr:MAG: DNA polymerase III subunit delta [Patescibacteria group bacterium]
MLIYIYGEDTFRSRQYLRQMVEQFKKQRDPQGYNVLFLDGKKEESGKLLGEMRAAPFLAEKRLVAIENLLASSDKETLARILEAIKEPAKGGSVNNIIIFWQGEPLSKIKEVKELHALLAKEKYAQEFAPLTGAKLEQWAGKEIEKRGAKIDRRALFFLCDNAGKDMWYLNSLMDQLAAYVTPPRPPPYQGEGVREIALADVQLFLEEKIDDNVFAMTDAIVSGNRKQAFRLLNEQRRLGEEELRLFGLICWQFRLLLQMRDLYEREDNLPSDVIAKKLGIHPYVAKKSMAIVRRYPLVQLKALHARLLDIDRKTKTGFGDTALLVDLFVGRGA